MSAKDPREELEVRQIAKLERRRSSLRTFKPPDSWLGVRHIQILMMFLCLGIGYIIRVTLSVGIVAMTDSSVNPNFPTYDWTDQSIILSSFFWGYVVPQVGAGAIAQRYGPKWFLVIAMIMCSIFSFIIPYVAQFGSWYVMVCRVLQGFAQGFFFPSLHNLLGKWAPLSERSRLGTFVFAGAPFGTVISMPLTGWICGTLGWPYAFYLSGVMGFGWAIVFSVVGSNGPSEHKTITDRERNFIEGSLGVDKNTGKQCRTPWGSILTSLPLWAIMVTHCAQNWMFWTLLTELPTYMSHVLMFNIKSNGVLSALPYFVMWLLSFVFSGFTDLIINREWVSITAGRKIANSIGLYIPAVALILLGALSYGAPIAITLLIIAMGFNASHMCGYQVNHIDLSPTHAGILMGITNAAANVCSFLAPMLVQYLVTDNSDVNQWRSVFYTSAVICIVGNTFYVFFGSGNIQLWDNSYETDVEVEVEMSAKPEKVENGKAEAK